MSANQQNQSVDTDCRLDDLPGELANRDGWRDSQGNLCYQHDLIRMLCIKRIIFLTQCI